MVMQQGGINELVNQKADAYRGNPQALEKRYQQNQQLLDLLALQKVKSDKEAAARDMQLKMDQNPNTIAQQREQEVLAMTKDDMSKQVSGILGQRQKQQQKNMQRTAKGQGIPAAQPPQMAAQGGIMGYAHGGEHNKEGGLTAVEERLKAKLGANYAERLAAMTPEVRENTLRLIDEGAGYRDIASSLGEVTGVPSAIRGAGNLASRIANSDVANILSNDYTGTPTIKSAPEPTARVSGYEAPKETKDMAGLGVLKPGETMEPRVEPPLKITPDPKTTSEKQTDFLKEQGTPDITSVDKTRVTDANQPVVDKATERMGTNVRQEAEDRRTDSDTYMRRDENREALNKEISGIEAFRNRQLDPEKLRREGLRSVLTGIGQRGLVGGAIGAAQADQQVQGFERTMRQKALENRKEQIAQDIDVGKVGQEVYNTVYASLTESQDNAMRVLADISQADAEAADREADRLINVHQTKINNQMQVFSTELEEKKLDILNNKSGTEAILALVQLEQEARNDYRELAESMGELDEGRELYLKVQNDNDFELDPEEQVQYAKFTAFLEKMTGNDGSIQSLITEIKSRTMGDSNSATFGTE